MKKRPALMVILSVLFALIAMAAVVYITLPKFTIVQDESWKFVMPKNYYLNLRYELLKERKRLSFVKVAQGDVYDVDVLESVFEKLDDGRTVLVSPVVTSASVFLGVDVRSLLSNSYVIGIGNEGAALYFDAVLVSNTMTGWVQAANGAVRESDTVAVIYDDSSVAEARMIVGESASSDTHKYNAADYGNLFASEIGSELNEKGVGFVFCPYTDNMDKFFSEEVSQQWIVDYRMSPAVPKKNLYGVVCPDLITAIRDLDSDSGELPYVYRKIK